MSHQEKALYIKGIIQGYTLASIEVCHMLENQFDPTSRELLDEAKRRRLNPAEICIDRTDKYTRLKKSEGEDVSYENYVNIIDSFYKQHPEYRTAPAIDLLTHLADGRSSTEDQLYHDAVNHKLAN